MPGGVCCCQGGKIAMASTRVLSRVLCRMPQNWPRSLTELSSRGFSRTWPGVDVALEYLPVRSVGRGGEGSDKRVRLWIAVRLRIFWR